MRNTLSKIKNIISVAYRWLAITMVAGIFIIMVAQCFFRYILNNSITWSEELARFMFVWASMAGAVVVTGNHGHAAIKMLDSILPRMVNNLKEIIFDLVAAVIGFILFFYGIKLTNGVWNQNSAALKLCYAYVYMAIPVGGIGITVQSLLNALATGLSLGRPEEKPDADEDEKIGGEEA